MSARWKCEWRFWRPHSDKVKSSLIYQCYGKDSFGGMAIEVVGFSNNV